MNNNESLCKCCRRPLLKLKSNTEYCKECKRHHRALYAKWDMGDKRNIARENKLFKDVQKTNLVTKMDKKRVETEEEQEKRKRFERLIKKGAHSFLEQE